MMTAKNEFSELPRGLREEAATAGRGGGIGGEDDCAHGGRREGHSAEIQVTQKLVSTLIQDYTQGVHLLRGSF